ncbi:hypothetical protein GGU10DRAFT_332043 [Lentinula aff. detonsa]|uniref:Uncharacterized protein n=1 Tax=Lentinula aff. detonsa TaxID=2804958 RepID=A0AA38KH50_9AGAR|nr:hypothetical protein GGU10DRAFT_332043 [Lentinula aff. detonsa]
MLVSRWRDSKEGYPRSLYLSLNAGARLNRKYNHDLPDPTILEDVDNTDIKIDSVRELDATSLLVPNRAFFQPGREHKFEAYQFTEVINKLKKKSKSTRTGTIGVPAHVIDLPKHKSDAYKIAFKLNTYPQPVHHQLGHRPDS